MVFLNDDTCTCWMVNDSNRTDLMSLTGTFTDVYIQIYSGFSMLTYIYGLCCFQTSATVLSSIHIENVDKSPKLASEIMEDLLKVHKIPQDKQVSHFTMFLESPCNEQIMPSMILMRMF